MKTATLAIIVRDQKVLLGWKKKGEIGTKTLNGPGGKLEDGESPVECVMRETEEELGIELDSRFLAKVAILNCYAGGMLDMQVHVFRTSVFSRAPRETDDMVPEWHEISELPYDRMLESDREWFKRAAEGDRFSANIYYKERASGFERIVFSPANF